MVSRPPEVSAAPSAAKSGRPPATSREALERVGFRLFARRGFDETTVDDIVTAAGIGRRTFFRYFASKNDLVWGDFEGLLAALDQRLVGADPVIPMMDTLRCAVIEFNRSDPADLPWHRQRMELILTVPTLQADATLRYAKWRGIVESFAARRMGLSPSDMMPRLIGHAALGAALAAYEDWLSDAHVDLPQVLDVALRQLTVGLGALDSSGASGT